MSIYPEGSYYSKEALASNKLNAMVTDINNHDHEGIDGKMLNPTQAIAGSEQGALYYDNGTTLTKLSPGSQGTVLRSNGASQNPEFSLTFGVGKMEIHSTASDNFELITNTNTPDPSFNIGYGNGSGSLDTSKEYISANDGTITLNNASLVIDNNISVGNGFFGASANRSINTSYLAATDGFVTAYTTQTGNMSNTITGYTDAASTPTTPVAVQSGGANQSDYNFHISCITFPVKRGHYYRVTSTTTLTSYKWIPMGV